MSHSPLWYAQRKVSANEIKTLKDLLNGSEYISGTSLEEKGSEPTHEMKFQDNSLIFLIISLQIPWFSNHTLQHFIVKFRLKTQNVKQNLLIS